MFNLERAYRRPFDHRTPPPYDLFRLAERDPTIMTYIQAWKNGHCSWEAALIAIITAQHGQVEKLMEHATVKMMAAPRHIIIDKCSKCGHTNLPDAMG